MINYKKGGSCAIDILFVCTGNTCRSPMAEGLANKYAGGIRFFSRGICAPSGAPASANAVKTMLLSYGIDIKGHSARGVSSEDIERAALILTMTGAHLTRLAAVYPYAAEKLFVLGELAGKPGGADISDPYGGDLDVYVRCAREIKRCIETIDFMKYI